MSHQAAQIADAAGPHRPRPARKPLRAAGAGDAARSGTKIAGVSASLLLALFIGSLLIPVQFRVAGLGLTPYNILLILFILPMLLRFLRDPANRITALDVFMALHVVWLGLAILYNHGPARAVFIVNQTIILYGGYMVGRVMIRNAEDYRLFFRYFFYGLLLFLPFAVVELVTRQMIVSDILSNIANVPQRAGQDPRLGLHRVQAFYDHSIGYGLFCSIGVANTFYIHRDALAKRLSRTGLIVFMTFISLSSAPNIAQGLQLLLIGWDRAMRILRHKWIVLAALTGVAVAVFELAFEDGLVGLVIENLAFEASTGWGRTEIFQYGSAEVLRHPVFGIGLGDWVRPYWRKGSVDNFWLLTAMRYGLPSLIFLWIALGVHAVLILRRKNLTEEVAAYRSGHLMAWVGVVFVLGTVHIWGSVAVFVMAYIGAGSWFYTGAHPSGAAAPARVLRRQGAGGARAGAVPADPAPFATPSAAGPPRARPSGRGRMERAAQRRADLLAARRGRPRA